MQMLSSYQEIGKLKLNECRYLARAGKGWYKMPRLRRELRVLVRVLSIRCKQMTLKNLCPLGSVVEHSLHTRGVSSSNLLAGTNIFNKLRATQLIWRRPFCVAHSPFAHHDPK